MSSMTLLFLLVTSGAFVTSLTGLGGGTLVLAGLLMVYPPELAIPLHSFNQLAANGLRTGLFFKSVNWRVVGAYSALLLPGAWIGALIFEHINPSWLKVMVGALILFSVLPFNFKPKGEPSFKTFLGLGAFSGFLGIFVGAVGPLIAPYFNRLKISRDGSLSTKSAGQMFLQVSKILAFSGTAAINFGQLKEHVLLLIIGTVFGVLVSIPIGKKISDARFNQAVDVLLALISFKVLYEGISELYQVYF